jgi:hypothetical protein
VPTSEGRLYRKVLASALLDMAKSGSNRDRLTAEAFFFEPDAGCDNHPRADCWCWWLGLDPDFVREIARKIADHKIDVVRRVEEYRSQGGRGDAAGVLHFKLGFGRS